MCRLFCNLLFIHAVFVLNDALITEYDSGGKGILNTEYIFINIKQDPEVLPNSDHQFSKQMMLFPVLLFKQPGIVFKALLNLGCLVTVT